jgi:D-glycero-D-manno-heptose 1,7-bisphosphate phosphatase
MLLDNGIWISDEKPAKERLRPALFLDRDGVVVKEAHYLSRIADVALEHGAVELLDWARREGLAIVVVTNQSGIARGLFGWATFEDVHREITRQLDAHHVAVDLTVACAFHEDHTEGFNDGHASWRKPGPAMLELAAEMMAIDLARSWMVGDRVSDIGAARNAKLAGAVHVETGHGAKDRAAAAGMAQDGFRVMSAEDPLAALQLLQDVFSDKRP